MPTICETEPLVVPYSSASSKVQMEDIPSPVDRTFRVYGMSECQQVTIVVKDGAGTIVYGPKKAPPGTSLGTEYYWTADITLLADCPNATVYAYCVNEEDGDHRGDIVVVKGAIIIDVVDDPGPGQKPLKFKFRINTWRAKWQSSIFVVSGRLKNGNRVKYSHIFTENPPREQPFDFGCVEPGIYVGQFTVIDGQTSVTTVTSVKVIKAD